MTQLRQFLMTTMVNEMEQRKHPRIQVKFRTTLSSNQVSTGEGMVAELSLGGCHVASFVNMRVGTELILCLYPSNTSSALTIDRAIVRWSRQGHFGVEFLEFPQEVAQELGTILNTVS